MVLAYIQDSYSGNKAQFCGIHIFELEGISFEDGGTGFLQVIENLPSAPSLQHLCLASGFSFFATCSLTNHKFSSGCIVTSNEITTRQAHGQPSLHRKTQEPQLNTSYKAYLKI